MGDVAAAEKLVLLFILTFGSRGALASGWMIGRSLGKKHNSIVTPACLLYPERVRRHVADK